MGVDDQRWAELEPLYRSAVYTIDDGTGPAPATEVAARHGTSFVIITAHNPLSVVHADEENAARNAALATALEGERVLPAEGASPDGAWSEASFAVAASPRVYALAEQFGQAAVLEVDGSGQHVRRI